MSQGDEKTQYASAEKRNAKTAFLLLLGALAFGIAYTQPALYYSNQNQYFLHGMAQGGRGFLHEDWLANTADPTPAFSALIAFTNRFLSEIFFYLYYLVILGIYFLALDGIFTALSGNRQASLARFGFLTLIVAIHSGPLRWASAQLCGVDYPWYFQAGVANQYVLGAGLQPSVFGVLLLLSVAAFLHDRSFLAVTCSSLAAAMHSTYLLTAALLTLAYLILLCRERRFRAALFAGAWALLLVAPVLVYNLRTFAPSSAEAFASAQHLLAQVRIPHHARIERWLDGIAWGQIGWIVLAMLLVRGSRLFAILLVIFTLSFALSLVQIVSNNDTLALLFPWRSSAILVPLATTIILTRLVNGVARWLSLSSVAQRALAFAAAGIIALLAAGGAAIDYFGMGYRTNTQEIPLLEYIRDHKSPDEVYLLPVEVPRLTAGQKGAASLNFTPPPRRSQQRLTISVDLQRFRLFTGAPIYIDFKSIPYKDVEVLEWYERVQWNHDLFEQRDWNRDQIEAELAQRRITHVITTADRAIRCDDLTPVYRDDCYILYRLRRE